VYPPPPPPATTKAITEVVEGNCGVTELDAADAEDAPAPDVARTVNVYAVPAVKPETVIGEDAPVPVNEPGLDVTV